MENGGAVEESKDNRNIVDNNQGQKLTAEEIEALKHAKAGGQEIID